MSTGSYIYEGLLSRGLSPVDATAWMDSFVAESGLNPGINEVEPLVPGSRGGFGLYQTTGPRRVSMENMAASRGVPADDVDLQLDHLLWELENTESKAAKEITAAETRADKVRAITKHFLRPAKDNSAHRIGAWGGGPDPEGARAGAGAGAKEKGLEPDRVSRQLAGLGQRFGRELDETTFAPGSDRRKELTMFLLGLGAEMPTL